MYKRIPEYEIKAELNGLTVICDSREQDKHVQEYFTAHKIKTTTRKLDVGDYSFQIGDITFERDIAIERKRNLDEICGNFTVERERFEREFLRAKANGTKVYLIIENATWTDIFLGNYRSKFNSASLLGSLLSWMVRFNITVLFCRPEETARIIWNIFYYFGKEELMYGTV